MKTNLFLLVVAMGTASCAAAPAHSDSGGTSTATPDKAGQCWVTPPAGKDTEVMRKAAADINIKILDYVTATGSIGAEQKAIVNETFQAVSDGNALCAMLLQSYTCLAMNGNQVAAHELKCTIASRCGDAPCTEGSQ